MSLPQTAHRVMHLVIQAQQYAHLFKCVCLGVCLLAGAWYFAIRQGTVMQPQLNHGIHLTNVRKT